MLEELHPSLLRSQTALAHDKVAGAAAHHAESLVDTQNEGGQTGRSDAAMRECGAVETRCYI